MKRGHATPALQAGAAGSVIRQHTRVIPDARIARARRPSALHCAVLATLAALAAGSETARAQTTEPPQPSSDPAPQAPFIVGADSNGVLYLEVLINGETTEQIAQFFVANDALFTTPRELTEVGIRTDDLPVDDHGRIPLASIPGLKYTYEPRRQRIDLQSDDSRRIPATLANTAARPPVATAGTGLVVNYQFTAQPEAPAQYGVYSEQRFFYPGGIVDNTGTATRYGEHDQYIRLDTSWRHSNPDTLVTTRVGDAITSSLTWTRPVRLGGVQVSRDFSLRPDLITYPVPTLAGSTAVPSSVDLYVNSVRQYSGNTPSGPFVINAVPSVTGAGEAVIVTKDVLGRNVMTTVPLYIDARLLSAGLADFSVEAGFIRRDYSLRSADYAGDPSLSASLRYGVSTRFTLETHAEATRGVYNGGVGALWKMGELGVLNASVAASAGDGGSHRLNYADTLYSFYNPAAAAATAALPPIVATQQSAGGSGMQLAFGWQYRTTALSVDLQAQRATSHYSDLASSEGTPPPRASYRATVAAPVRLMNLQSTISASYIGLDDAYYGQSKIASFAYTATLPASVSLSASVYHDFGTTKNTGAFVAVSFPIGKTMNASVSAGAQQGKPMFGAALSRTPDYDGGFGWQVQDNQQNGYSQGFAQGTYRGKYGDLTGSVGRTAAGTTTEIDGSGSLVVMAGDVLLGRQIDDAFALVSTDGVPDVPVLHENRVIGKTNGAGHYLVPDLQAYEPNHLAIDPLGLPPDTVVNTSSMNLAPQARAGVLASFTLQTVSGAQIRLVDPAGKPLPAGASVTVRETGKRYVVGYDGLAFIDELKADNHLMARWSRDGERKECAVDVPYKVAPKRGLATIGPFPCRAETP